MIESSKLTTEDSEMTIQGQNWRFKNQNGQFKNLIWRIEEDSSRTKIYQFKMS